MVGVQGLQRCVPGIEELVAQIFRVHQAPLPPAVLVAPSIALPAPPSPLNMQKAAMRPSNTSAAGKRNDPTDPASHRLWICPLR